jgi:hypothetical protein
MAQCVQFVTDGMDLIKKLKEAPGAQICPYFQKL